MTERLAQQADMTVAVLGLGSMGLRHARNLLTLGVRVIGADPDSARRDALEAAGGLSTAERTSALAEAGAAVIATPNACHLDDLRASIEAGCHSLVEKPLAHTDAGLEALLTAADNKGLTVFVGVNQRFNPTIAAARNIIEAGQLGQPLWARLICSSYLPDWRPDSDYRTGYAADPQSGGVLFDVIHEFDIASYLLGPAQATAALASRSGQLEIASEDVADVLLQHDSGVVSNLHLDYVTRPPLRTTEVAGTEGRLLCDLRARTLHRWDRDGALVQDLGFDSPIDDDYLAEMTEFLACCAGEARPRCDGWEGLQVLRQVLAARRLSRLEAA